jgi:hypothetical protein
LFLRVFCENIPVGTYYCNYCDDWGITSHIASIKLLLKLAKIFTVYLMYCYYIQTASNYFAPYEKHLSTEQYYTPDYDFSAFSANQYGFGFNHYQRTDGLSANIGTLGVILLPIK